MQTRVNIMWKIVILAGIMSVSGLLLPWISLSNTPDYSKLLELIPSKKKDTEPLVLFRRFEKDMNGAVHRANLSYLKGQPGLTRRVKAEMNLGKAEIPWRLQQGSRLLWVVPERRKAAASLLRQYCQHVIRYLLKQTGLPNPYAGIEVLETSTPSLAKKGITAFLVHNLAEEYVGTYTASGDRQKAVNIKLSNKTFSGDLGAYTSDLYFRSDGQLDFQWTNFTLWQTSAENPYSLLTVPVEETLHISLREYTHQAIRTRLRRNPIQNHDEIQAIIKDSMAVEEALAVALVQALLPPFLEKHIKELPASMIQQHLVSRRRFERYIYVEKAIKLVEQYGCQQILQMYRQDPVKFQELLISVPFQKRPIVKIMPPAGLGQRHAPRSGGRTTPFFILGS